VLLATGRGIGLMPDSADYLSAAENLLAGNGLAVSGTGGTSRPFTLWPPLYPFLLALGSLVGLELVETSRWLAALLFGGTVFMVGLAARWYTGSTMASVLSAALVLCSASLLHVFSWAQTDGLFIMLALIALLLLDRYRALSRPSLLLSSALVSGIACLARYSGATLVPVGIIVLLWPGRSLRRRLLDSGIFTVFSIAPLAMWLTRNTALTGSATPRDLVFHPIPSWKWLTGLDTLASWLVTYQAHVGVKYVVGLGALLVIAALVVLSRRTASVPTGTKPNRTPLAVLIFTPCYLVTVLTSIAFLDAFIPLDNRLLSPTLPVLVILVVLSSRRVQQTNSGTRLVRLGLPVLVGIWLVSWAIQAGQWTARRSRDGEWYTSTEWQESETIAEVRRLPEETVIYSNVPEAVCLVTGRPASPVPEVVDHHTGKDNPNYRSEMDSLRAVLAGENAVVVHFTSEEERRWYMPRMSELIAGADLVPYVTRSDGAIFYRIRGLTGSRSVLP
jgi:hypothetical protein